MQSIDADNPIRKWFAGLVEASFQAQIGLCDPPLLDYLAELLTEFIHVERIHSLADGTGRRVEDVAAMLFQLEVAGESGSPTEVRMREMHRHIGDYTLFWTGVYPEALGSSGPNSKHDRFVDYCTQGKRAYYIASTIPTAHEDVESEVLERLSQEFELCAFGLNEARKEWERRDPPGPGNLVVFKS